MNKEDKELINLVEEELKEENQTLQEIVKELNQWKRTFPNQTPQQVKDKLEEYASQQIERLSTSRNRQNNLKNISKKEFKICEICSQPRQDNFTYSRISNGGFTSWNVNHVYRICSFCLKTVQLIVDND